MAASSRGGRGAWRPASPIIRLRISGAVYTLLTVALGVVAINSGNNLLYLVTALMLGYMLASGIAGRHNITGAKAELEVPDEIYAGSPFSAVICLKNPSRSPLHMIEAAIRFEGEDGDPPRAFFGMVPPGAEERREVLLTLPRRGEVQAALEVSSVYPFDFFTRFSWNREAAAMVAFPTPLENEEAPTAPAEEEREEEQEGATDFTAINDASNVAGIRPYQSGDPMNRVHWKISARTGKLSTRIFDGAGERSLMIDLDEMVREDLESGLSAASGCILQAGRENLPVGMRDRGLALPPASGRQNRLALLRRLALYESGGLS